MTWAYLLNHLSPSQGQIFRNYVDKVKCKCWNVQRASPGIYRSTIGGTTANIPDSECNNWVLQIPPKLKFFELVVGLMDHTLLYSLWELNGVIFDPGYSFPPILIHILHPNFHIWINGAFIQHFVEDYEYMHLEWSRIYLVYTAYWWGAVYPSVRAFYRLYCAFFRIFSAFLVNIAAQ